jgi:hypothetical protein
MSGIIVRQDRWARVLTTGGIPYLSIGLVFSNPLSMDDVLIMPTSTLFIEMLLCETAAIERFEVVHRVIFVLDARVRLRGHGLENVRKAARILAPECEAPNPDQGVLVQGQVPGVVVSPPGH